MRISAIAIISKNRGLGIDNHLLFFIPGELARLKQITMGHPLIMGRKTHESIGRPLPGRLNIVISRHSGNDIPGELVFVDSLEKALEVAKNSLATSYQLPATADEEEIFILGGGQIFTEALPITDRLYLTIVDHTVPADVFFPSFEKEFTKVVEATEKTDWNYPYKFVTLER